jgi:hypothetical protein
MTKTNLPYITASDLRPVGDPSPHNLPIYRYVQFNGIVFFTMQLAAARARWSDSDHFIPRPAPRPRAPSPAAAPHRRAPRLRAIAAGWYMDL